MTCVDLGEKLIDLYAVTGLGENTSRWGVDSCYIQFPLNSVVIGANGGKLKEKQKKLT